MKTVNFFKYAVFALALGLFATACDDDDPVKDPTEQGDGNEGNEPGGSDPEEPVEPTTAKFVITSSEKALDLKSPAYLKVFTDLTQTTSDVQIVGGENVVTAPMLSHRFHGTPIRKPLRDISTDVEPSH